MSFWTVVTQLRRDGLIPRQWRRQQIRNHLLQAGFSARSIATIPFNASISRDAKIQGNYVKNGGKPMAYRVGKGLFELIDDPEPTLAGSAEGGRPAVVARNRRRSTIRSSSHDEAQRRLVEAVKQVWQVRSAAVNALKNQPKWDSDDFIWEALLISMATVGKSKGSVLVSDENHHSRVTWSVLVSLNAKARREVLSKTLQTAKVRMPQKKADWLAENCARIIADGGPSAVKAKLREQPGRAAKIAYLRTFRGIGQKYARNVMMDVYHPDFHDSIAYDLRIQKISKVLGVSFKTFAEAEAFYLSVASSTGLNGWELDRLLYNFTDEVIGALAHVKARTQLLSVL